MEFGNNHQAGNGHDQANGNHAPHPAPEEREHSHGEGRHGHQASLGDALDFVNTLAYNKAR